MALTDKLTAIGDAIRSKTGTTDLMTLSQMPELINGIETGGGGFPNGTEWGCLEDDEYSTIDNKNSIVSLYYANGLFLVSLSNQKNYWSNDGVSWIECTGINGIVHVFRYANGIWIAVMPSNGFYYSLDGKSWTQSNITSCSYDWDLEKNPCILYANGIWRIGNYHSTDGMEWSVSDTSYAKVRYIANANGVWLMVNGAYTGGVAYSTDGIAWVESNLPTSKMWGKPEYSNGLWVIGGRSTSFVESNTGLYYSTDGVTWTQSTTVSGSFTVFNYGGIWVAGSGSYHRKGLYYSTDGMTWTQSNVTSDYFGEIVYYNGTWVAAGSSNTYYSTNGREWTEINIESTTLESITNACGIWLATTGDCKGLFYSIDGATWLQSNISSGRYYYIVNGNGTWVSGYSYDAQHAAPSETVSAVIYSKTWALPTNQK